MTRANHTEGDWFAVPLRTGCFACGIVARANPRKAAVLGYFFGPRRDCPPLLADVAALKPDDAVLVGICSHLGLTKGSWPVIGRLGEWCRVEWPMPVFVRHEELTGRYFHAYYDDDDPARPLREVQIGSGMAKQGPKDGSMGAGFVEKRLTRLLQ